MEDVWECRYGRVEYDFILRGEDEVLVGNEYKLIESNEVYVLWFEVNVKGRGFGRKMWKLFEKFVKEKGFKKIGIESYRGNEEFWEKMGFKYDVDEKGERIESSNGYCMSKEI